MAVLAAALLAVAGSASLGSHLPARRALPAPPALEVNLSRDEAGLVVPEVDGGFIARALGSEAGASLVPTRPAPTRPTGPVTARVSTTPQPRPGQPSGSPDPSTLPRPIQLSELAVAMTADRSEVAPGGAITYKVTVTNIGGADFRGAYQLTAHVPFGTVDASSPCGGPFGIDPDDNCVNPPFPTPGSSDPSVHQLSSSFSGTLARGQRHVTVYRVRVNETTQPGTRLANHAHVEVVGDNAPALNSRSVVVLVRQS